MNNINTNQLSLDLNNKWEHIINQEIQNTKNQCFLILNNWRIWEIWKDVRNEKIFENHLIDSDWAISDINKLLNQYNFDTKDVHFLKKYSKLAVNNTCWNLWNDWIQAYYEVWIKLWLSLDKNDILKFWWEKIETKINASHNFY